MTPGLKRRIPHKSVVFAIDFVDCRSTDTGVAPWIFTLSCRAFHREPNFASDAINRQVTFNFQFVIGPSCHTG